MCLDFLLRKAHVVVSFNAMSTDKVRQVLLATSLLDLFDHGSGLVDDSKRPLQLLARLVDLVFFFLRVLIRDLLFVEEGIWTQAGLFVGVLHYCVHVQVPLGSMVVGFFT